MTSIPHRGSKASDPTKPHLSRDFRFAGKWQCISHHISQWGAAVEVVGKGYSRRDAYRAWQRNWANPAQPWNRAP